MKSQHLLACASLVCCSFAPVVAQEQPQVQPRAQVTPTSTETKSNMEGLVVTCLALGNQEEVELAKFGQQKAESDRVKKFAAMLESDHQDCVVKLQKRYPQTVQGLMLTATFAQPINDSSTNRSAGNPQGNAPIGNPQGNAPGGQPTVASNTLSYGDMVNFQKELASQCLADTKEWLSKDDHFDESFVGLQICKHQEMKTKLKVMHRRAEGELKNMIKEAIESTDEHLKEAESVMEELAKESHK